MEDPTTDEPLMEDAETEDESEPAGELDAD